MQVVREREDYIILDDFLEPRDFRLMLEYAQLNDYARNPKWVKPWDLADRPPWQSGETVYHPYKKLPPGDPRRQYPTGTALDLLIDRILGCKFYRSKFQPTCKSMTARSYLHPQGSSLDWHNDAGRFAGAYAFYCHPRWHASWGGELMLIEDEIPDELLPEKEIMEEGEIRRRRNWNVIHKDDLSELLMARTTSTEFIFPVPNRIVIMRRGLWHKIGLVKDQAPMARCSVAGFFLPDD
ncbi:MAG: hypothetical protein WBN65_15445 [Gammaproteobacteria bacterium]